MYKNYYQKTKINKNKNNLERIERECLKDNHKPGELSHPLPCFSVQIKGELFPKTDMEHRFSNLFFARCAS